MRNSFWAANSAEPGSEVLFRGRFHLAQDSRVQIRLVGASWYQAWLDGRWLLEGPFRYPLEAPEFQIEERDVPAGEHLLAIHARHEGVETRMLKQTPPYLCCRLAESGRELAVTWKSAPLVGLHNATPSVAEVSRHRINPQLGWVENRDTRLEPEHWREADFDDSGWTEPLTGASELPEPVPARLSPVGSFSHKITAIARGPLANTFGYAGDEPAHAFFCRDRICRDLPTKGRWQRYDLGRVRLGRPSITLDVPAGTIVEMAYAEALADGRVSPFINLSGGTSCNLDRFIARGGRQSFTPLLPKGGRFVEVHVLGAIWDDCFLEAKFIERCYHAPTEAAFSCNDPLLEEIWQAGAETHRACAEDALTDNPTRERGQWTGDAAATGLDNTAALFHDQSLCRRSLAHAALCAREDGLVAALSPGTCYYMVTYSMLWVAAVRRYCQFTGDRSLLEELWPAAVRNMEAIEGFVGPDGMRNEAGSIFVDWGYRAEEPVDPAANLFLLQALREMSDWAARIGHDAAPYRRRALKMEALLRTRLGERLASGGWSASGYHCSALALMLGLVEDEPGCLDYLASHLLDCFPNNPGAPRNDDPLAFEARVITPYFAHFVFPLFFERGRADFVLDQYRTCWGWLLAQGRTTLPEVFDTRWSHCHQWSGCPTWQMSRYLLGLRPRLDLAPDTFEFCFSPGSLARASGRIPDPRGGWIRIAWERQGQGISYACTPDRNLRIRGCDDTTRTLGARQTATWDIPSPEERTLRVRPQTSRRVVPASS
jgi:alpha-L-rhamnosidase